MIQDLSKTTLPKCVRITQTKLASNKKLRTLFLTISVSISKYISQKFCFTAWALRPRSAHCLVHATDLKDVPDSPVDTNSVTLRSVCSHYPREGCSRSLICHLFGKDSRKTGGGRTSIDISHVGFASKQSLLASSQNVNVAFINPHDN